MESKSTQTHSTISNADIFADIRRGFEWSSQKGSPECRSYSWIMEALKFFKLSALIPSNGSVSLRVDPQGLASHGSESKDAPDFTIVLLEDDVNDFQLGWWEAKLPNENFSRVFIAHYRQFLRYAKGMLLDNSDLERVVTMISAGDEFALLEWRRPDRESTRESPPPTSPDMPDWVPIHESSYYDELSDCLLDLEAEESFAFFRSLESRASLPDRGLSEFQRCIKALADVRWSPVIIFFGEEIFDGDLTCFSAAFLHALQLLFSPYEVPREGSEIPDLPTPQWEKLEGTIFDRSGHVFVPTPESLDKGRAARDAARRRLFMSEATQLISYMPASSSAASTANTSSYVPPEQGTGQQVMSSLEPLLRVCYDTDNWNNVKMDTMKQFLDDVAVRWTTSDRKGKLKEKVIKWMVAHALE